mmetsp:Transcript_18238/g.27349  ORF Transcript_18238/g.27349 Transcript_18238/m.27349 type:complete len:80 (+) Transcript_18238:271-510(+)
MVIMSSANWYVYYLTQMYALILRRQFESLFERGAVASSGDSAHAQAAHVPPIGRSRHSDGNDNDDCLEGDWAVGDEQRS